jgi:hypothetical protein
LLKEDYSNQTISLTNKLIQNANNSNCCRKIILAFIIEFGIANQWGSREQLRINIGSGTNLVFPTYKLTLLNIALDQQRNAGNMELKRLINAEIQNSVFLQSREEYDRSNTQLYFQPSVSDVPEFALAKAILSLNCEDTD